MWQIEGHVPFPSQLSRSEGRSILAEKIPPHTGSNLALNRAKTLGTAPAPEPVSWSSLPPKCTKKTPRAHTTAHTDCEDGSMRHYPQQHHLKTSMILLFIDPATRENCKTWLLQTLLCPYNLWFSVGDGGGRSTGADGLQKRLWGSCWTVRGMWDLAANTMGLQGCSNRTTACR